MKIVLTSKNGKRILVDTLEIPTYKDLYNDEHGQPFIKEVKEIKVKEVEAPKVKKTVKKAKKKVTKK